MVMGILETESYIKSLVYSAQTTDLIMKSMHHTT